MHYRGKIKKRLSHATVNTIVKPGDMILDAGEVVDVAYCSENISKILLVTNEHHLREKS